MYQTYFDIRNIHREKRKKDEEDATNPSPGSPVLDPSQYDKLIHTLHHKVPREIYDKIQEDFLELAFHPGFVFPQQFTYTKHTFIWKGKSYPVAKPGLLCLNSDILATYQKRLWSENTFVIGVGIPSYTTDFLGLLPQGAHQHIRKVYLSFTSKDHLWWPWTTQSQTHIQEPDSEDPNHLTSSEAWQLIQEETLRNELDSITAGLWTIWFDKYYAIHTLSLDELTLDFTECYSAAGEWLGTELAERLRQPTKGLPSVLKVSAPSLEKKKEIMRVLVGRFLT
ncbi:MAG: hypothetical protein Q9186_000988 [Xanthomendoza sp. 1 TL-2023]